jgi:hypothetical protein
VLIATPASAAVTKLSIEKTSPMPGGYELLEGHFSGALDLGSAQCHHLRHQAGAEERCRQGRIFRHLRYRPPHR